MRDLHPAVTALDEALDAAAHRDGPWSPALLAELDEAEQFPAAAVQHLDDAGVAQHYVPAADGGRLSDYSELTQLVRTIARRDLTPAVGHVKTFLGAVCVWAAGDGEQRRKLSEAIRGGAQVSWGLTERDHGADLLSGELTATPVSGGWRLDGEKWLINNATRGRLNCVLARTDPAGGPRGFSLFLVDKRQLPDGAYTLAPKIATHGIRGADISGITFQNAFVPGDALIGPAGSGIHTVLTALQLTRTICVGLSLGAADHAFQLTAGFLRERQLYGQPLRALPQIQRFLGTAAATALLAEAAALAGSRSVHALPGELSVTSAVTKALVPTLVQEAMDRLTELMGVRGFLSQHYQHGRYAKLERDHRIVAIFDGSTVVNRQALIDQFPLLARRYPQHQWDPAGVREATDLAQPLTPFDGTRQQLTATRGNSLLQSLPDAVRHLTATSGGQPPLPRQTIDAAHRLAQYAAALHRELAAVRRTPQSVPTSAFHLAEQYELLHAAAASLWLWHHNAPHAGDHPLWRDGLWLRGALGVALTKLGAATDESWEQAHDLLAETVLDHPGHGLSLLAPLTRPDHARSSS